jgi:hypothetical protein
MARVSTATGGRGGGGKTWWWKLCGREDTRRENYLGAIRKVRIPSIVDCDDTWGQHKKRLSCKHRGFTFWTKETEIGDKKKVVKKGEPVNVGLTILFH